MTARKRSADPRPATPGGTTAAAAGRPARARFPVWAIAAAVMLAAIALLYPDLAFRGKVFFASDNQAAAAFASAGKKILAQGEYPVWNPYVFGGMPSFGSLAYTPYVYPVNYLLGLLVRFLFFPEYTWLLFHTFLTGLGTYLLLRDRGLHAAAAVAGGVAMMWMPNLVAVGANGHGSQACAVAYLPLALWLWDRAWRGKNPVASGAALAIVFGLSMLRGHLQISYYTYLLVGLHALFFGAACLVDAARGRPADVPMLPRALRARLGGEGASPLRPALAGVGFALVVLAAVVGVSFLMSAVLYWPVHDYAQYSIRGASSAGGLDYGYATSWSLHPSEMLTFLVPHAFGFGKELYLGHMPFTDYPNYLGVVVLAFAVAVFAGARSRWIWFLGFIAAVTTLVSFGRFFPVLYDPLFKLLPYFSKFRVPVMILIVQQLAVVALFAAGLDHVMKRGERSRRIALRVLIAAGAVFLVALFSQSYWTGGFAGAAAPKVRATQDPSQQLAVARMAGEFLATDVFQIGLIGLALAGLCFLFATNRRMSAALFAVLVLALGMADYARVNRYILHPETFRGHDAYRVIHDKAETERYAAPDEMVEFLRGRERPFRVFPMDSPQRPFGALWGTNRFMMFGIESIGGYHPAKLSAYEDYIKALAASMSEGRFDLLDMLNARYIVAGARLPDHPRLRPLWTGRDFDGQPRAIYENLGAYPRAWVVREYRIAEKEETLALLASGGVDPRRTVLLERAPDPAPAAGDSVAVRVERWREQEVVFSVELDAPGILVASEIFYPDWKATVDGEPAAVLRANHLLRAVALGPGRHEVVFRYDAALLRRSASVSIGAFAITLLALAGALVARGRGARWKRSS